MAGGNRNGSKIGIIIIVILVAVILIGGIGGYLYMKNNTGEPKEVEKFAYTTEDMYCNVKDSKKIVKIRISVATTNEKSIDKIEANSYLIRDTANKIIRNTVEKNLEGNEGQVNLQEKIMLELMELMPREEIVDVYFDDFVIQ